MVSTKLHVANTGTYENHGAVTYALDTDAGCGVG